MSTQKPAKNPLRELAREHAARTTGVTPHGSKSVVTGVNAQKPRKTTKKSTAKKGN